jgi:cellulose biosynthesis protein BcsQ
MGNYSADFSTASKSTLGIIGLPELAQVLRNAGVNVITGSDFKESAIAIRDAISGGGVSFPVLISDEKVPTKKAWANRIAGDTSVFLLDTHTEDGITCEGARNIQTPVDISKLLLTVGLDQYAAAVGQSLVEADGTVGNASGVSAISEAPAQVTAEDDYDAALRALLEGDDDDEFNLSSSGSFDPFSEDDLELPAFEPKVTVESRPEPETLVVEPIRAEVPVRAIEIDEDPFGDLDDDDYFSDNEKTVPEVSEKLIPVQPEAVQRFTPAALYSYMEPITNSTSNQDVNPWAVDEEDFQSSDTSVSFKDPAPVPSGVSEDIDFGGFDFPAAPEASVAPVLKTEPVNTVQVEPTPRHTVQPVDEFDFDDASDFGSTQNAPAQNDVSDFDFGDSAIPVTTTNPFSGFDEEDDEPFIPVRVAAPMVSRRAAAASAARQQPIIEDLTEDPEVSYEAPYEAPAAAEYQVFDIENTYEESAPVFASDSVAFTPQARSISNEPVIMSGTTPILFVWGSKGGVGKTTMAITVAQRAASMGINTILIDGNRGQGDIRHYLNLQNSQNKLPSVYDIAVGHDASSVIIPPAKMREIRGKSTTTAKFALVQAPLSHFADPAIVTGWIYNRAANAARDVAQLVVVDTQTLELFDTTGLVDTLVLPAIAKDAYSLAVTDLNIASTSNLKDQLKSFSDRGMNKDRTMVLANLDDEQDETTNSKLSRYFSDHATYIGSVDIDSEIKRSMNRGSLPVLNDSAMDLIDAVLLKVTKDETFAQTAEAKTTRGRLFRKGKN